MLASDEQNQHSESVQVSRPWGRAQKNTTELAQKLSFLTNPDLAHMVGRMASESRDSQFYLSCGGFELSRFLGKHDRQGCENFQSQTQPLAQHTPRSDTLQEILCCH